VNVALIVTNFNNSCHSQTLCESLSSCTGFDFFDINLFIIDNKSNKDERFFLEQLESKYSFCKVLFNKENVGYFSGLNVGLNYISNLNYDFVIIGNNDLEFNKNFFLALKKYQVENILYPVISPDIVTLDNVHQNPHVLSKISVFREILWDLYYSNFFISKIMLLVNAKLKIFFERKDYVSYRKPAEIYQGYGACYILTPLFFQKFNTLWSPTFLMGEEFFLWKQISDKGYNIFYDPSICVKHVDHASTSKLPALKFWNISKESHKVYRKYVGWFGVRKGRKDDL